MHRGKEEERHADGEESQERRVERQIGGEGKQARQSEEKKEKMQKAREGRLGGNDNDSMKEERGKRKGTRER